MLTRNASNCGSVQALHPCRRSLRSHVTLLHFPSAYEWRDMLLSPQRGMDHRDKVLTRGELQYAPHGASGEAFLNQCGVAVDGTKRNACHGMPLQNLACGRHTIEAWHRNVSDNDIWVRVAAAATRAGPSLRVAMTSNPAPARRTGLLQPPDDHLPRGHGRAAGLSCQPCGPFLLSKHVDVYAVL